MWDYTYAGTVKGLSAACEANQHAMDYAYLNKFSFYPGMSAFVLNANWKDLPVVSPNLCQALFDGVLFNIS